MVFFCDSDFSDYYVAKQEKRKNVFEEEE